MALHSRYAVTVSAAVAHGVLIINNKFIIRTPWPYQPKHSPSFEIHRHRQINSTCERTHTHTTIIILDSNYRLSRDTTLPTVLPIPSFRSLC